MYVLLCYAIGEWLMYVCYHAVSYVSAVSMCITVL